MSVRLAVVAAALVAATAPAAEPRPIEFHRVRVPAGRLGDVPLDGGRYVPMPLREFDAAVARARADGGVEPAAPATSARWAASLDDSGMLMGTVSCDVGPPAAGPGRFLPLHGLIPSRAVRIDQGPVDALVCGVDGSIGVATPQPGRYEIGFACPPLAPGVAEFRLQLVPALATSLDVEVPAGLRPVLSGAAARRAVMVAPPAVGARRWRIDLGPAAEIGISLEPDGPPPGTAVWADVVLAGSRATLAAMVVPAEPWRPGRLVLEQDQALRVTGIRAAADDEPLDHEATADGRGLMINVPRWLDGRRTPLVVHGVAPATGPIWRLPLLRVPAASWTGGGCVVRVDPALAVQDIEPTGCRIVPPEAAATWPSPSAAPAVPSGTGMVPVAYAIELQEATAACAIEVAPRSAVLDVARVTTVELTPAAVLGRAACDVRVAWGEAFDVEARVAPGWIIESVDAVDWPSVVAGADEFGGAGPREPAAGDRLLDWRVEPSPAGDRLRIGLAVAATAGRGVGLRITGHRGGLPPGAAFTTADLDMVRFDGETTDGAVIDVRTDADAFVEIAGRPAGWFEVGARLAPLVEEGRARGRIPGGDHVTDQEARLVRRRPPLDVRVNVRLEPREDAVVESFTFDCRAEAGLESLVVDFAEPGGEGLAWRVDSPTDVAVAARPLGPTEGGLAARGEGIADSWLVELSPPPSGPVRLRAVRSVPLTGRVPVPLAWVEGASEPGGTVVVAAAAGVRPRLVNHTLRHLAAAPEAAPTLAEFAFDGPAAEAAAELLPVVRDADARAWAWRETIACWCEASGATESESRFDVENEGRAAVALSLARGRRLEAVHVDGVVPPGVEFGPAGGTWRIPLPSGGRRVEIVVRTVAAGRPGRGAWLVEPAGCSLDLPVLDREVGLLLPPGLVTATGEDLESRAPLSWLTRLTGLMEADDAATGVTTGFRRVAVAPPGARGVLVVRRTWLAGAGVLAAVVVGIAAFARGGRATKPTAFLLAVAPAVAALWVPAPFVPVARAASWAALAGLGCAWWRGGARLPRLRLTRAAAVCLATLVALPASHATADEGLRVFVMPGSAGDTALVPEPLFRALGAFATSPSAAIRVIACRIEAAADAATPWQIAVDVDADVGGALVLDAGPGAEWVPGPAAAGVRAVIEGREVRLTAGIAGRHTVPLALAPAIERGGAVETATAGIPVAPSASVRVAAAGADAGRLACEVATAGGPFVAAPEATTGLGIVSFDVSTAGRVRLARPVDPRDRLASGVRAADTVDEVSWGTGGCRVEATIDLDAGPALLRSFVVRVDRRLEDLASATGAAGPRLVRLGAGRALAEFPEPVRGRMQVRLSARLPLVDPVGVFDVPGIWLEGVPDETRTIRLTAAADLEAVLDSPPVAGVSAAEFAGRPPARLVVRRSRQQVRGVQNLSVSFAATGMRLALGAQLDAAAVAVARIPIDVPVGCVVDRVALLTDDPAEAAEPVDAVWTRTAADRVLLVVQRPRPGRFRLEVDARLERPPAARGRLPVVRAALGAAVPLLASWTAAPPLVVTVTGSETAARVDAVELPDGAVEPEYELQTGAGAEPVDPAPAPVTVGREASRVERAEVRAACDGRGRLHGLARFDLIAAEATVGLRLPSGMRLFDVLVDGRAVAAEPRAADAWDLSIGAATWPRTILVVFAGDAGRALAAGVPLALAPPRLEGLPESDVIWSLRPPTGFDIRVAPPARSLDAAALAAARSAARDRVSAAFDRAAAALAGPERERLAALAALRGQERGPAAEEAWSLAAGWPDAADEVVTVAAHGPLVIRAVRAADGTLPARALATVALVAAGGLAWTAATRGRGPALRT